VVEGQDELVEVGLAERDGDERIDDVDDERGDNRPERAADDKRDGQLNHIALVEKVTKALHDFLLVPRSSRIPRSIRLPLKGSAS
jgi:hypothetical protein